MRETRKSNPAAQCSLQGDKLYIDHKYDATDDATDDDLMMTNFRCYVWSDTQAKVVEHTLVLVLVL